MLDESPILCVALDGGLKLGDLPFVLEPQFSPQPTPKKDLVSRIQRSSEDFFGSPAVRLFSQASWGVAEFRAAIKLRTPHFPREPGDPGLSPLQLTRAETRKRWESQQNQPEPSHRRGLDRLRAVRLPPPPLLGQNLRACLI